MYLGVCLKCKLPSVNQEEGLHQPAIFLAFGFALYFCVLGYPYVLLSLTFMLLSF
jgi:hypothetical protein